MTDTQQIFQGTESARNFIALNEKKSDFFKITYDSILPLTSRIEDYTIGEMNAVMLIDNAIQETIIKSETGFIVSSTRANAEFGYGAQYKPLIVYYDNIVRIYTTMLIQIIKDQTKVEVSLQLAARTIFNLNRIIKWNLYNYTSVSEHIWQCMNSTFRLAEQQNLLAKPTICYPLEAKISIEDLFIQGHMLSLAGTGYFNQQEVDLIHNILKKHSNRIQIQSTPLSTICFTCSIDGNKPVHILLKEKISESNRFWSMDPLTRILNQWRINNLVGEEIAELPKKQPSSVHAVFLNKLLTIWTKFDLEIEKKTFLDQPIELNCVSQFAQITDHLYFEAHPNEKRKKIINVTSLEMADEQNTSTPVEKEIVVQPFSAQMVSIGSENIDIAFELSDISLNLYSIILWKKTSSQEASHYALGFLNRLQRGGAEKIKAGVTMLGTKPVLTFASHGAQKEDISLWRKKFSVILCRIVDKKTQKYCIICEGLPTEAKNLWTIQLNNRSFSFKMKDVTHAGNGWYCIGIDILPETA